MQYNWLLLLKEDQIKNYLSFESNKKSTYGSSGFNISNKVWVTLTLERMCSSRTSVKNWSNIGGVFQYWITFAAFQWCCYSFVMNRGKSTNRNSNVKTSSNHSVCVRNFRPLSQFFSLNFVSIDDERGLKSFVSNSSIVSLMYGDSCNLAETSGNQMNWIPRNNSKRPKAAILRYYQWWCRLLQSNEH